MATFVLIHGAWHGSWCWKRVRAALQGCGHDVFTPTLTGLADRAHLLSPQVNLETHITDIVNLLQWEELTNVVLCGHSYAGAVIRGVADRVPERIEALIYLDACVPENGQSVHDLWPAAERDRQLDLARKHGDGWKVPPIPPEVFRVNARDRRWVRRMCTVQPLETLAQPLHLTGAVDQVRNVTYVLATGWKESPFPPMFTKAQERGWKTVRMPCGHDVMLDMPEEVTRVLLAAI